MQYVGGPKLELECTCAACETNTESHIRLALVFFYSHIGNHIYPDSSFIHGNDIIKRIERCQHVRYIYAGLEISQNKIFGGECDRCKI